MNEKKQEEIYGIPINVAIPNTSKEKMKAIASLCESINILAKALISVQVDVTIANNKISNTDTGISVYLDEDGGGEYCCCDECCLEEDDD